jgi:hypothetical protein
MGEKVMAFGTNLNPFLAVFRNLPNAEHSSDEISGVVC